MRRASSFVPVALVAMIGLLSASACGGSAGGTPSGAAATTGAAAPGTPSAAASTPAAVGSSTPSATASTVEKETDDLDRSNFTRSSVVDHQWFPLEPGAQLVHKGFATIDGERLSHDVVFTVTDLVKQIDGVQSAVVYELDYSEGKLAEAELAFFAQDDDGTVWRLGEYPEVYEDGKMTEAPTWVSGQEGAKAGITMKADPQLGAPSYAQGWGPAVDWKDRGRVVKADQKTCVKAGCYSRVLVTEEFSRDEPDAFQLKYYAPGVGNVRVGWSGAKDKDKEELELIKAVKLDAGALAKVRSQALALEKHAYQVSKNVYGTTKPMQRAG
jgi:hypothetical protein